MFPKRYFVLHAVQMAVISLLGAGVSVAELPSGQTAFYTFDGVVQDDSGNGNHGIPHGDPMFGEGYVAQALLLDGIDDYVELPASLIQDNFTFFFWIRTTAEAPTGDLWFEGLGIIDGDVCGVPEGNDSGLALIDGGHLIFRDLKTPIEVNDGNWHSLAVSRDLEDHQRIYVDGLLIAEGTRGIPGPLTGMPWIGVGNNPCDVSNNSKWFAGEIDELVFYDRALSVREVQLLAGVNVFYFPQLYDIGMGNDSVISVNNIGDRATNLSIFCWKPDGEPYYYLTGESLQRSNQLEFRLPIEFGWGSCVVAGNVAANATWNFQTDDRLFNIGVAPLKADPEASYWHFPVGYAPDESLLGVAVHNPTEQTNHCKLCAYVVPVEANSDLTQVILLDPEHRVEWELELPPMGQIASFFGDPFSAPEGMVNVVNVQLLCQDRVYPIVLTQDPTSGFPTPVSGTPIPD